MAKQTPEEKRRDELIDELIKGFDDRIIAMYAHGMSVLLFQ